MSKPVRSSTEPTFFATPEAFRRWLAANHAKKAELLVGFHKKATGKRSLTYQEALDEALAFGWIDGVRRSVNEESYSIRFTPRKARSVWSAVNIKRVKELIEAGRMLEPGLAAFEKRDEKRSAIYSYERETAALEASDLRKLRADAKAWAFYDACPPGYKRTVAHWITSAKKADTRERRLAILIESSRKGQKIPPLA